jgi:tRNA-specific 2-thiouridylase
VTLDLRAEFRETVVAPFASSYEAGETPNPCMRCNGGFRFRELLALAERAGAEALWTGHYARIVRRDGMPLVARGVDAAKDQSYMLATVEPRLLARVRFPLGARTKEETRAEAERAGLAAARRPESQEACFLGGGDYRAFLERQGLVPREGSIVDEEGAVLGTHAGHWRFTPGQRRGLGLAAARPLYVLRTEPGSNTVVVGPHESLAVRELRARGRLYVPVERCEVQVRHRATPVPALVEPVAGGFTARLEEPAFGVARGQVAVLYDGDAVVGAGVVRSLEG